MDQFVIPKLKNEDLGKKIEDFVKRNERISKDSLAKFLRSGPGRQVNLNGVITPGDFKIFHIKNVKGDLFQKLTNTQKHLICLYGRRGSGKSVAINMYREEFLNEKTGGGSSKYEKYNGFILFDAEKTNDKDDDDIPRFKSETCKLLFKLIKEIYDDGRGEEYLLGFGVDFLGKLEIDDTSVGHVKFITRIITEKAFDLNEAVGIHRLVIISGEQGISFENLFEFYVLLLAYKNFDLEGNNDPNYPPKDKKTVFFFDNLEDHRNTNIERIAKYYNRTIDLIEGRISELRENMSDSVLARYNFDFREQFKFVFSVRTTSKFLDLKNNVQLDLEQWEKIPLEIPSGIQYDFINRKMDFVRRSARKETRKAFLENRTGTLMEWLSKPLAGDKKDDMYAFFNYNFRAAMHVLCSIVVNNESIRKVLIRIKDEYKGEEGEKIKLARRVLFGALYRDEKLVVDTRKQSIAKYFEKLGLHPITETAYAATKGGAGYSFTRALLIFLYWEQFCYEVFHHANIDESEFRGVSIRKVCEKFLNPLLYGGKVFSKVRIERGILQLSALGDTCFELADDVKWDGYLIEHYAPTSHISEKLIEEQMKLYADQVKWEKEKDELEKERYDESKREKAEARIREIDELIDALDSKDVKIKLSPAGKFFVEVMSKSFEYFLARIKTNGEKASPETLFEYDVKEASSTDKTKKVELVRTDRSFIKPIDEVYKVIEGFITCNANIINEHCVFSDKNYSDENRDLRCYRTRTHSNEEICKCSIVMANQEIPYVLRECIDYLKKFAKLNPSADYRIREYIEKYEALYEEARKRIGEKYDLHPELFEKIEREIEDGLSEVRVLVANDGQTAEVFGNFLEPVCLKNCP